LSPINIEPDQPAGSGRQLENTMRRLMMAGAVAALLSVAGSSGVRAQGETYRLVPNWPTLPAGMWFGLKEAPPPPAEREAQAAARRARGGTTGGGGGLPTNQPGISGLAIDQHDRIFVFNRGPKPVMVFDTAGTLLMAGPTANTTERRSTPTGSIRAASTGTAMSTSSSATPIASSSSIRRWTRS
jgi:hypothetical protein